MFDFYLLKVEAAWAHGKVGGLSRGYAHIRFPDLPAENDEYFDLRGPGFTERQFLNWAKREFGYLRYEVKF